MLYLETERLRLTALTPEHLELCLSNHRKLEEEMGMPISQPMMTERVKRAVAMKIAKMALVEAQAHAWYTYWLIVIKGERFGAGLIGFKGVPDSEGEVEIGYGIDPVYQNRGYVTEAVRAMIAWAFREPGCKAVIAPHTSKLNHASNRVLEKIGMEIYHETDEELFWRIERDAFIHS
jgi:ribosomal-protein-alanine N-acetyltransferase